MKLFKRTEVDAYRGLKQFMLLLFCVFLVCNNQGTFESVLEKLCLQCYSVALVAFDILVTFRNRLKLKHYTTLEQSSFLMFLLERSKPSDHFHQWHGYLLHDILIIFLFMLYRLWFTEGQSKLNIFSPLNFN